MQRKSLFKWLFISSAFNTIAFETNQPLPLTSSKYIWMTQCPHMNEMPICNGFRIDLISKQPLLFSLNYVYKQIWDHCMFKNPP